MPTTRSHSRLWVAVLAVVAVAAAGANWLYHLHSAGPPSPGDTSPPAERDSTLRVVAFGHVDVEFGVRSLYPLQPGRVAEVLVHEGDVMHFRFNV